MNKIFNSFFSNQDNIKELSLKAGGFTMMEAIVSIGIIAVIATVGTTNFFALKIRKDLSGETDKIVAVLREAQDKATNQEGGVAWGVKFFNQTSGIDYYEEFYGASYSGGAVAKRLNLPSGLDFYTPVSGNSLEIVFGKGTGQTGSQQDVVIQDSGGASNNTITIYTSGRIGKN